MPGPSDIPRGNIQLAMLLGLTISPAQVAINTTVEQTFTLNGLQLGDIVAVTKPTTQAIPRSNVSPSQTPMARMRTRAIGLVPSTAFSLASPTSDGAIIAPKIVLSPNQVA